MKQQKDMKILKNSFIIAAIAALITSSGCKKLLVEQPRAALYPNYFGTAAGVQAAVVGVYYDLRNAFSGEGLVFYYDGTDQTDPILQACIPTLTPLTVFFNTPR